MEYYEACSVKEIQQILLTKKYDTKKQVREHLKYLENLASEITKRFNGEIEMGNMGWEHKNDLRKVKSVYIELQNVLEDMEKEKSFTPLRSK